MTITAKRAARVFVLEPINPPLIFDPHAAEKFGELVYVFERGELRSSIWHDEFCAECLDSLEEKGYDPARDFLLVVGKLVPITRMTASLARKYGAVRALFWHAVDKEYVVRIL